MGLLRVLHRHQGFDDRLETIACLVGATFIEQNDEWAVARRYLTLETVARFNDAAAAILPAIDSE